MASHALIGGGAQALPLGLIAQAIPMLTRHELASLCERMVDALDALDPDADLEAEPDDEDGNDAEHDDDGF